MNKEIAARLHLSVRTVESHVRHTLTKTAWSTAPSWPPGPATAVPEQSSVAASAIALMSPALTDRTVNDTSGRAVYISAAQNAWRPAMQ